MKKISRSAFITSAIFALLFFITGFSPTRAHAANKFWVGGTDSWDGTAANKWATASGGSTTTTLPTTADNCFFDTNSTGTVTIASGNTGCGSLDFTGFTQTATGTAALSMTGSLTMASGMTNGYSGTISFTSTSTATSTITSNSIQFRGGITVNASNTVQLADALNVTSTQALTLTIGRFDGNGKAVTVGTFSSSNSNVRTLTMGSGQWTLTGNNAAIWDITTATNITLSKGSLPIISNYAGATGTRTVINGNLPEVSAPDYQFTGGTDTVTVGSTTGGTCGSDLCTFGSLNFTTNGITGFAGTFTDVYRSLYGDLTLSSGMTMATLLRTTFFKGTSGTKTIITNGKTMNESDFKGDGATWQLGDDFSTALYMGFYNGTFNANNKNITIAGAAIVGSTSSARTVNMGNGTWTLSGDPAVYGQTWNTNGCVSSLCSNLTLNPQGSTIKMTSNSATESHFQGGGLTYNNIWVATTGAGATKITGSNTFNDFKIEQGRTVKFTDGTTQTVASFTAVGTIGAPIVVTSTVSSAHYLVKTGGNVVDGQYLSLSNSHASPANTWYAGPLGGSTNNGGNTGWNFPSVDSGGVTAGGVGVGGNMAPTNPSPTPPVITPSAPSTPSAPDSGSNGSGMGASGGAVTTSPNQPQLTLPISQYKFLKNLRLGMVDDDVKEFQKYLNANGFMIAINGAGSPGQETTKFGALTKAAVIKFQEFYKDIILTPAGVPSGKGTGFIGPFTRGKINGQ
jgi:Putative peptidoglycan binding domain